MKITLLIAHRETLYAELLASYINKILPAATITQATDPRDLTQSVYDLAVVELTYVRPETLSRLDDNKGTGDGPKIILLTSNLKDYFAAASLENRVSGIVDTTDKLESFGEAIHIALAGGSSVSPKVHGLRHIMRREPRHYSKVLTDRQLAVLKGIAGGKDTKLLASELSVTPETIIYHKKNCLLNLGLHSERELVAFAHDKGLVPITRKNEPPAHKADAAEN